MRVMITPEANPRMKPPFRVAELDHVVLRCRALDPMLSFYQNVLGLTEERRVAAIGLVQLRAGASMLDLVPAPDKSAAPQSNMDHFCLGIEIDDLQMALAYLRERGVRVVGEPARRYGARGQGWSIYIRDPEGNTVELKQLPRDNAR